MKIYGLAATMVASVAAWKEWDLPSVDVEAIEKSHFSRYALDVKYGPFIAIDGNGYAYIYTEIYGDDIKDGAVVTTFATIAMEDWDKKGDIPFETPECRVKYSRSKKFAGIQDVDIRTYGGTYNDSFTSSEYLEDPNITVWNKSFTLALYNLRYQSEYENGESRQGCYMERKSSGDASEFAIKNGEEFRVNVGYNVYEGDYDLKKDRMIQDDMKEPDYSMYS